MIEDFDTSQFNEATKIIAKIANAGIWYQQGGAFEIDGEPVALATKKLAVFVQVDPNATDVFNLAIGKFNRNDGNFALLKLLTLRGEVLIEYALPLVTIKVHEDDDGEDDDDGEFDDD